MTETTDTDRKKYGIAGGEAFVEKLHNQEEDDDE